jgi:hypothetical protein
VGKTWKNRREMGLGGRVREKPKLRGVGGRRTREMPPVASFVRKHPTYSFLDGEFQVDIHGFSVAELLSFFPELEQLAREIELFSFIVIHGKGEGRLRDEVRKHYGEGNVEEKPGNAGVSRVYWKGKVC